MQGNYLEQALGMIHSRRLAAEQQNRERIMEIESRIPEVSEVNYQMFRTSRDLMQIIVKGENTKERVEALRQQNLQAQEMIRRLLKNTAIRRTIWNSTTPAKNAMTPVIFSRNTAPV